MLGTPYGRRSDAGTPAVRSAPVMAFLRRTRRSDYSVTTNFRAWPVTFRSARTSEAQPDHLWRNE